MGPTVTLLLSIGICLDWVMRAQMDTPPRPTLWAMPSPMVYKGADVTLRCQGHLGCDRLQLWMDGEFREERNASWEPAEFVFRKVDDFRDARSYSCRCGQGHWWSNFSEPLALVVMTDGETEAWREGLLPTPSISASANSTLSPGTTVTIRCQMSPQSQSYSFALLEAKSLEPLQLQSPEGTWAHFSITSVRAEDTGRYSCINYKKTAPHMGSYPSKTLELTVSGPLPKPTLQVQSGLVTVQGANVTLWCSRPKLSFIEEVTFTLWKTGTQEPLQHQISADLWTSFLLPSVRPEDTGSYSCAYRERRNLTGTSEPSDVLELVVPGSLPRPSLSALPGLLVQPGTHVTLQCRLPPHSSIWRVTFFLLKVGNPQFLQSQNPSGTLADFSILSVRIPDAGNYMCVYRERMDPYWVSEPSGILEIWVTDALSKPSLSVWPGPEVTSGANVTFLCRGPSRRNSYVLYKERHEKPLLSLDTTQDGVQFFLSHVTPKDSGNYSCVYQSSTNGSLRSQHSDLLELTVKDSMAGHTLIIMLSCVSFFLLLLCLLLLSVLCQRSIYPGSFQGNSNSRCLCCPCLPLSTCLPHHPEDHREEVLNTGISNERSRQPLVPMAEEPQAVTYAQLNINILRERKIDPTNAPTEPSLYATVSKD